MRIVSILGLVLCVCAVQPFAHPFEATSEDVVVGDERSSHRAVSVGQTIDKYDAFICREEGLTT